MITCIHNLYNNVIHIYFTFLPSTVANIFLVFSDVHPTSPPCCLGDNSGGFGRAGPWHADGFRVVQGWCSLVVLLEDHGGAQGGCSTYTLFVWLQ